MKKLLLIISIFLSLTLSAQQLVFDPAVMSTLIINHTAQQATLKDIKSSEAQISAAQKIITVQMTGIRELHKKMYNSLSEVSTLIKNAKDVVYASKIAADIGKYQAQMVQIAEGDPKLLIVALKTEAELIRRTADLFTYIYSTAFLGGDINLMSSKDRLDIITHVIDELRVMRGLAYSVTRRMKVARYAGIMKTLNPLGLIYPNNGAAIVKSLLEDL